MSALDPCLDCGQEVDDQKNLIHLDTCPLSRAEDDMALADREWFLAHPGVTEYYRPIHAGDMFALRRFVPTVLEDTQIEWTGRVHVRRIDEDTRARTFEHILLVVTEQSEVGA